MKLNCHSFRFKMRDTDPTVYERNVKLKYLSSWIIVVLSRLHLEGKRKASAEKSGVAKKESAGPACRPTAVLTAT